MLAVYVVAKDKLGALWDPRYAPFHSTLKSWCFSHSIASIAQQNNFKNLTRTGCNDWDIAMFQLATSRHVSGRNITYVRLSVFLTSCQVNFMISCTFGQCPFNTITAGLRSCVQFIQLHKSASILESASRQIILTSYHIFGQPPWRRPLVGEAVGNIRSSTRILSPSRLIPRAVYAPLLSWSWLQIKAYR